MARGNDWGGQKGHVFEYVDKAHPSCQCGALQPERYGSLGWNTLWGIEICTRLLV